MKKEWLILAFLVACAPQTNVALSGYVEGDYVFVSASAGGVLDSASVKKGQTVSAGAPLFPVDKAIWDSEIARTERTVDRLTARLAEIEADYKTDLLPELMPLCAIVAVIGMLSVKAYGNTLD